MNIASGTPVELRDAVACITDIAGTPPATVQFGAIASAPGDPPRLLADTSRMRTEVGWEPRWDLERGLKQTIDWWRERCRA